jgi:hypothetical protein
MKRAASSMPRGPPGSKFIGNETKRSPAPVFQAYPQLAGDAESKKLFHLRNKSTVAKRTRKGPNSGDHGAAESGIPIEVLGRGHMGFGFVLGEAIAEPAPATAFCIWLYHRSLASFRFPQWASFLSGLNTRSTWRFKALMTPIRANTIGPPSVATTINASMAACHSWTPCSAFGSLVM